MRGSHLACTSLLLGAVLTAKQSWKTVIWTKLTSSVGAISIDNVGEMQG